MMCNDWIKEFKGWCKSFTRTEILLAILEAILLIICIAFLIFLILHFLVCSHKQHNVTSTTPFTAPTDGDDNDNYKPNSETNTQRFVYIHKGEPYSAVVTIPFGTGTEKVIFINKGVPTEVAVVLPHDVPSMKGTVEDGRQTSYKEDYKETTAKADAVYDGIIHKEIHINKETTFGNVTGGEASPLDGVPQKVLVINKETTPVNAHDYSPHTEDSEKLQDDKLTDDNRPPKHSGELQYTSPTLFMSDLECSWHPSDKTVAPTHYYLKDKLSTLPYFLKKQKSGKGDGKPVLKMDGKDDSVMDYANMDSSQANEKSIDDVGREAESAGLDALAYDDQSDGEESLPLYKSFVLALVKVKPSREVQFGCTLTAVTAYWTLTAASCIEAIEEVDSLDTFVMMEGYGEDDPGRTYAVADVQVHPMYQGANRSHDLAALRSEERLRRVRAGARLPTLVDYFAVTAAERFTIVGFGSFRRPEARAERRALREVRVYALPARQCPAAGADVWALRHLQRGRPEGQGPSPRGAAAAAGPLCAGVLYARGAPCVYCAGTPLLRAATLLGLMSDGPQCAVACEPALYVNVAAVRDWLLALLSPE